MVEFRKCFTNFMISITLKTAYNKLAKIYANCFGHVTKVADMSMNGKNLLKIFFSRTREMMTLGLGM